MQICLGLDPDAFAGVLRIDRPILPRTVNELKLSRLRVGAAQVDLRFRRRGELAAEVETLKIDGSLHVQIVPQ